jgi:hypothetical protein
MKLQSIRAAEPRRAVIAGLIAALFATLPLSASAQSAPAAAAQAGPLDFYTVINVGPQYAWPLLNERGQVAYTLFNMVQATSGFFDGERVRPIGSLGGYYTSVRGLNNHGVVAGIAETKNDPGVPHAFTWTSAGGTRALSGASESAAFGVNDRGESVGWAAVSSTAGRATRWNPNGSATPLGPLTGSGAQKINKGGHAAGFAPSADGPSHVALWDRVGAETNLGPVGDGSYHELRLNDRNEVAGLSDDGPAGRMQGFLWRRDTGRVPIDAGQYTRLEDLNNRGEVVGGAEIGGRYTAFYWASGRGVLPLPRGAGEISVVADINERGEMTGALQRPEAPNAWRAVRWPSFAAPPIDLNARLYRAPAGLQLSWALKINDRGEIVADSNAGLVMLRPGPHGTAAPVLGPVVGIPATINPGQDLTLTVGFIDSSRTETHKASAVWTDGCASPAPTVTEGGGVGQVRLQHRFCALGYHNVNVTVTDSGGRATELRQQFVVYGQSLAGGVTPGR